MQRNHCKHRSARSHTFSQTITDKRHLGTPLTSRSRCVDKLMKTCVNIPTHVKQAYTQILRQKAACGVGTRMSSIPMSFSQRMSLGHGWPGRLAYLPAAYQADFHRDTPISTQTYPPYPKRDVPQTAESSAPTAKPLP